MMKQARTLLSRSLCDQSKSLFQERVKASTLRGFASWSNSSAPGRGFSGKDAPKPSGRLFAPYSIFKGKSALSVEPTVSRGWSSEMGKGVRRFSTEPENDVPTSGISRPLAEILKELNKKVPDSVIRTRVEDGFSMKYIPWHIVNRIMNMHAPEWSGEIRSVTYSPDGNTVTVAYRVTLYGTDAEIFRESTGTTSVDDKGYGDAVQKAEAMAFRRACARFGLGLHLYHEDAL